MKKTLQRELNYKNIQLPNEKSVGKSHSEQQQTMNFSKSSTSLIALSQLNSKRNQSHLDMPKKESLDTSVISLKPKVNGHLTNLHDDVNFKYLKHVVLKFLCSKEYEVILFPFVYGFKLFPVINYNFCIDPLSVSVVRKCHF